MSGNRHIGYIDLGILQMQILWLLNRKDTHGYELMKNLNEIKNTKITQGTLYPALQRLEELNLIKSKKALGRHRDLATVAELEAILEKDKN